jgi:hypothetical protein
MCGICGVVGFGQRGRGAPHARQSGAPPVSAEGGREAVRVLNTIVEELDVATGKQMTPVYGSGH